MKHIKLFEEFVTEKKKVYDYGCAMLYFDFPEMENHPEFRFEEGVLKGIHTARMAFLAADLS